MTSVSHILVLNTINPIHLTYLYFNNIHQNGLSILRSDLPSKFVTQLKPLTLNKKYLKKNRAA